MNLFDISEGSPTDFLKMSILTEYRKEGTPEKRSR